MWMNTKRVHMQKGTNSPGWAGPGFERRRAQRRRILAVLRGICLKLEQLQPTKDARLACREVAEMLSEARARESGRNLTQKET